MMHKVFYYIRGFSKRKEFAPMRCKFFTVRDTIILEKLYCPSLRKQTAIHKKLFWFVKIGKNRHVHPFTLTLLHSERPKLYATGLRSSM